MDRYEVVYKFYNCEHKVRFKTFSQYENFCCVFEESDIAEFFKVISVVDLEREVK